MHPRPAERLDDPRLTRANLAEPHNSDQILGRNVAVVNLLQEADFVLKQTKLRVVHLDLASSQIKDLLHINRVDNSLENPLASGILNTQGHQNHVPLLV